MREGPDQPGVVGRLVVQQVLQPGCQSIHVLIACRQDAGADQHLPHIVQRLGLRQVIEQVVSDGITCPGQAAEQLGRSALAQPGHHGGGVGDRGECHDGTVAPAPEAGPGRAGPATPADRAARGDPLAGPGFPADRADRRSALIAAVAQVRGGCRRPPGDLAGLPAAPARALRSLVARGADRADIGGPGDGALLAAGRARADRARRAELAAGAAVGHPGSGASHPAAPAAFRHDLLVLVIASRADTALGTPGVNPPGLSAASTRSLAVTGRAGAADPARDGLAPQVGRDPAAPRAGRNRNRQIPGLDQRAGIGRITAEQPQRVLVVPGRGHRDRHAGDERFGLRRLPLPRVLVREYREPPHQLQPRPDRIVLQEPSTLLRGPTLQHRLEHRRRRIKVHHTVRQRKAGSTPVAGPGRPRSLPLAAGAERCLCQRTASSGPLSARSPRVPQHPGGIRRRLSTGLPGLVSRLRQRACSRRPLSAGRLGVSQDPGGIRRGNSAGHTQIPRHAITSSPSALICGVECDVIQVPARHDISSRRSARPDPCRPGREVFQRIRYSGALASACCI